MFLCYLLVIYMHEYYLFLAVKGFSHKSSNTIITTYMYISIIYIYILALILGSYIYQVKSFVQGITILVVCPVFKFLVINLITTYSHLFDYYF